MGPASAPAPSSATHRLFAVAPLTAGTRLERLCWCVLAAGALAIGSEHLYLWHLYFHRVDVIGPLFILDFAASLPITAAVVALRTPLSALLAGGFALATLAAFLWSSLFGLFGYHETLLGHWQLAAASTEIATALIAGLAIVVTLRTRPEAV